MLTPNQHFSTLSPPLIIAEMSGNHSQSLDRALAIVEAAAAAGAHAIKLQTYTADTMTLNLAENEFMITASDNLWAGQSLYDLYQKACTPWEWHAPIFQRARELGLMAFSTPFDATAVDFLESLNVPCYKIASFENTDLPLIRKVAATGKPLLVSTGMATIAELDEAVRTARQHGCPELVLLKCTSTYPASPESCNLATLPHLRELFNCEVGVSDHTTGLGVAMAAVALGASVVEKHFTLSRSDGGVDAPFSLEPQELKQLVTETRQAWEALGKVFYGPTPAEQEALKHRRSLYIVKDMKAGEILSPNTVRSIRPGLGLPPKYLDAILGRRIRRNVSMGTALSWELIG